MEDKILARSYKSAVIIFLIGLIITLGTLDYKVVLGFVIGFLLGIGPFLFWNFVIKKFLKDDSKKFRSQWALLIILLKLPILGAIIFVIIKFDLINFISFIAGMLIMQIIIALRAIGNLFRKSESSNLPIF